MNGDTSEGPPPKNISFPCNSFLVDTAGAERSVESQFSPILLPSTGVPLFLKRQSSWSLGCSVSQQSVLISLSVLLRGAAGADGA